MSGDDGEGGWKGEDGRLYLDVLPCKLGFKYARFP